MENHVEITYCKQCRWLLRSAWMAQELLSTFDEEITELTLRPGTGGIFEILVNGQCVWSRKEQGGFPEITQLKQIVRDIVAPQRHLGHVDKTNQRPVRENSQKVEKGKKKPDSAGSCK